MLKIRRPLGRLIFNMGIAIPGKTVFLIETAPCITFFIALLPILSSYSRYFYWNIWNISCSIHHSVQYKSVDNEWKPGNTGKVMTNEMNCHKHTNIFMDIIECCAWDPIQYLSKLRVMNCFAESQDIFKFSIISRNWNDSGSWNHSSWKTRTRLSYIVSTQAADDLSTDRARASADIILTQFLRNIPASALKVVRIYSLHLYHSP